MTNSDDRIRSRSEETACDSCGYPLYVGDRVVFRFDLAFCSSACAAAHKERLELRHDDDACHGQGVPVP